MKKSFFAVALIILVTALVFVIKTRDNKEIELEPQLNANSSNTASSSFLTRSSGHSVANSEDLERIKTAMRMRETAPALYGKSNKANSQNYDGEIPTNAKENTPLTTNDGTVIRPNKYAKAVAYDDGDKGLELVPNQLGLPKLTADMKYLNCAGSGNIPFPELKRRAETADSCAYFDYASAAFANLDSLGVDMTKDREKWKEKTKPYMDYLLKAAIEGNHLAASELGCHYASPPFEDKTEGLAWTMVATAMGANEHIWAGDCTGAFLGEPEKTYVDAIERAKFYIDYYNFKVRQPQ